MTNQAINNNNVNITFDKEFLSEIRKHSGAGDVTVTIPAKEFRQMMHKAEMYDQFSESIKDSAKSWDSLHPATQRVLKEYQNQPLQISPVWL